MEQEPSCVRSQLALLGLQGRQRGLENAAHAVGILKRDERDVVRDAKTRGAHRFHDA